jgi:drug/metabolite transporter (DMT)-like permease
MPQLVKIDLGSLHPYVWFGLLYSALLSLVVAYLLYNRSVRKIGSVQTSMYGSAIPVITALVAWGAFGERPTVTQALGAALIISGVVATRRDKVGRIAPVEEASAIT